MDTFIHNSAHNIRKDRIRLIRSMYSVAENLLMDCRISHLSQSELVRIINDIRKSQDTLSISQEQSMCVSYARVSEDKYNTKRRVRTTLGKYITRNHKPNDCISASIMDMFVGGVWSLLEADSIVVTRLFGDDVMNYYETSPSDSCMTGHSCSKVKLYSANPDKVSLLVYDNVRALLWTCDDGVKVLDRAYPAGHVKIMVLREWAKRNGYILRVSPDKLESGSNVGLSDGLTHTVTLNDVGSYPYLDTFTFGSRRGTKLVLSNDDCDDLVFRQTDGGDGSGAVCSSCGERDTDGNELGGSFYCDECYCDRVCSCEACGDTYDRESEDVRYVDADGYYCNNCFSKTFDDCYKCDCVCCRADMTSDRNGYVYCERCKDRHLEFCEGCDEWNLISKTNPQPCPCGYKDEDEDDGDGECEDEGAAKFGHLKVGDVYYNTSNELRVIERLCGGSCGSVGVCYGPHAHIIGGSPNNWEHIHNILARPRLDKLVEVTRDQDSKTFGLKVGDRIDNETHVVVDFKNRNCYCGCNNTVLDIYTLNVASGSVGIYHGFVFERQVLRFVKPTTAVTNNQGLAILPYLSETA